MPISSILHEKRGRLIMYYLKAVTIGRNTIQEQRTVPKLPCSRSRNFTGSKYRLLPSNKSLTARALLSREESTKKKPAFDCKFTWIGSDVLFRLGVESSHLLLPHGSRRHNVLCYSVLINYPVFLPTL